MVLQFAWRRRRFMPRHHILTRGRQHAVFVLRVPAVFWGEKGKVLKYEGPSRGELGNSVFSAAPGSVAVAVAVAVAAAVAAVAAVAVAVAVAPAPAPAPTELVSLRLHK